MTGKKILKAKKPIVKKKPEQMSSEEYNGYLERETINILKIRQFYSEVENFARSYYRSCQSHLRRNYPEFEDFKEFLSRQVEGHLRNLEKIVKQKYSKGLP
ncbi:MAG: hypothetical protein AABX99_03990 [Nanoarchaeota archaeon]